MTTHRVGIVLAVVGVTFAEGQSLAVGTKPTETRPATTGPATQPAGLSPVTFVVTDRETGRPVPEFTYNYWIETKEGYFKKWDDTWIPVQSPTGTILIDAPQSCSISLGVRARDYLQGWSYPVYRTYVVQTDDTRRRFEVALRRGAAVRGVIRAENTGKPVAGARISPIVFMPPSFTNDPDRFVTSDENGRFELHGVDLGLGITAEHPEYLETRLDFDPDAFHVGEDGSASVEIALRSGPDLHGTVRDPQGNPVEGVQVSDGAGKKVSTDARGKFVLRSPQK